MLQDAALFSVICPQCGTFASTTVGDGRAILACPSCGSAIDLATDEARHARQAAAAKHAIRSHQDDSG